MRILTWVLVALLGSTMPSLAQPKNTGPTMSEQAAIDKAQKEAYDHMGKQRWAEAAKAASKVYQLTKKALGEEATETAYKKQFYASMVTQAGDIVTAERLHAEMAATAEKKFGSTSREVLHALSPLVSIYHQLNRYDDLDRLYQRLIALSKQLDGELSSAYASQLTGYGSVLNAKFEFGAALRMYEEAVRIHEAVAPAKDDITLVSAQQVLASTYWQLNQRTKAQALFDKILATVGASQSPHVMWRAGVVWGVAMTYFYGGREDLAKPLMKRSIDMYEREVARLEKANPDDPMLYSLVGLLGLNYRQSGDLVAADKALSRAVAMEAKRGGMSAWASTLAELKHAQGKPREALALLERAAAGYAAIAPRYATAYNTMIADVLRELGDFKGAEAAMLAHVKLTESTYGKKHPMHGMAQLGLARIYMVSGKTPAAEKLLDESLDLSERELALVLKTGTESDHQIYFGRNAYLLDLAIDFHPTYAAKSAGAIRLGATTLLRRKGRVLDAAAASLATIRSKLSPDDKKLLDELAAARAKLAKLMVAGPSGSDADYQKEIAALEAQIQKLELQIGKKSAAYRVVSQAIELPAIQKLVPRDTRLVEIVNYQPTDPKQSFAFFTPGLKLPARRYAAYVIAATGDPAFVDLGPADVIDTAVEALRKSIANPKDKKTVDHARALHALTMGKIAGKLGGATNVLVAPDGTLNLVPFSALVDDKGQFLIKKYTFTYLTSGRDLLRLNVKTQAQGGGVIFADPAFDKGAPAPKPAGSKTPTSGSRGARSADLASLMWPQLPGTAKEADEIEKTMRGLKVFRGERATENALKQVHGPKVLHLATHGFFLPDEPPPAASRGATTGAPPGMPGSASAPPPSDENPLLRSGLALAGANKLVSGEEDGILTAMEASGLDLWGTKLVVLSACETGAGKVTNGDGVYGLRRALVIAGAESLVMTLWQVDDEATKELMTGYYKQLKAGKGRSSALRDIQLELQARPEYAHPYYWASFLPAGDNAPLK